METWIVGEVVGDRGQRKFMESDVIVDRMYYSRSAVRMLDEEISEYVDILQGVAQGCTLSPDIFKTYQAYINDLVVAAEAAKQGVTVGEDTVPGSMFADDLVGISETPRALRKRTEKALECTTRSEVGNDGGRK